MRYIEIGQDIVDAIKGGANGATNCNLPLP